MVSHHCINNRKENNREENINKIDFYRSCHLSGFIPLDNGGNAKD